MQILPYTNDKYIKVLDPPDPSMLLGWRQRKSEPWVIAENNLVNRIVLGIFNDKELRHAPDNLQQRMDQLNADQLKPYQVDDVMSMLALPHCLNANPMGLGKTIEAIKLLQQSGAPTALIVTPKIIRYQWQDQLKRWANIDANVYENGCKVAPGFWIVNYDKLRNEATLLKFRAFQWSYLIVDEAHKIKSRSSQQTKAVKSIPARHRVALTGTPILRYVDDLWSILNFLDPSYACNSYYAFVEYFCKIQRTPWGDRIVGLTDDARHTAILNQLLDLICIRNSAVEVAHGKTREVIKLPMSKKQRELYRKEKQLLLDELPEQLTIPNGAVLTLRLMQTTSWPGLYLGADEPGPKFEWILETCLNNPKEKFVVFSVFEKTISALVEYLTANKVEAVKITGQQSAEQNELSKRCFVERGAQVLAGTIGAMGQGYDGLQQVCRLMIFIDRDWSPEILNQAEDRLRRMGQDNPVTIYYLECSGSFDQHVGRINRNKAEDIREALADDSKEM